MSEQENQVERKVETSKAAVWSFSLAAGVWGFVLIVLFDIGFEFFGLFLLNYFEVISVISILSIGLFIRLLVRNRRKKVKREKTRFFTRNIILSSVIVFVGCFFATFLILMLYPKYILLILVPAVGLSIRGLVVTRDGRLIGAKYAVWGILLSIVLPVIFFFTTTYASNTHEIRMVWKYPLIKFRFRREPELMSQFPEKIPDDAKEVRMSYLSGYDSQSGINENSLQLKMKLPAEKISNLYKIFDSKKKGSFLGEKLPEWNERSREIRIPNFLRIGRIVLDNGKFPDYFVVMSLGSEDSWNNGSNYGVAVSKMKNEIIYWADKRYFND